MSITPTPMQFIFDPYKHILSQINQHTRNLNPYHLKYDVQLIVDQQIEELPDNTYEVYPQTMEIVITPKLSIKALPGDYSFQELIKFLKDIGAI